MADEAAAIPPPVPLREKDPPPVDLSDVLGMVEASLLSEPYDKVFPFADHSPDDPEQGFSRRRSESARSRHARAGGYGSSNAFLGVFPATKTRQIGNLAWDCVLSGLAQGLCPMVGRRVCLHNPTTDADVVATLKQVRVLSATRGVFVNELSVDPIHVFEDCKTLRDVMQEEGARRAQAVGATVEHVPVNVLAPIAPNAMGITDVMDEHKNQETASTEVPWLFLELLVDDEDCPQWTLVFQCGSAPVPMPTALKASSTRRFAHFVPVRASDLFVLSIDMSMCGDANTILSRCGEFSSACATSIEHCIEAGLNAIDETVQPYAKSTARNTYQHVCVFRMAVQAKTLHVVGSARA